jgi:hypothetical protein
MVTIQELCNQLTSLYPEFGTCDDNMDVSWDENNQAWAFAFEYRGNKIRHYLDNKDAAACLIKDQCVGLGIEFGQFR